MRRPCWLRLRARVTIAAWVRGKLTDKSTTLPTVRALDVARVFACVALAFVVSMFYRGAMGVIAPELMAELSMDPSTMGFVTGIFFLFFAAAQIPVGMALDRFGPRKVISTLSLIAVAGAVVFALSDDWLGLALGRALLGLGCAATLMGSIVTLSRWVSLRNLGAMVSLLSAAGAVGALLATTPFAWVVEQIGWRNAFFLLAGFTLFVAALVVTGVRDQPGGRPLISARRDPGAKCWPACAKCCAIPRCRASPPFSWWPIRRC